MGLRERIGRLIAKVYCEQCRAGKKAVYQPHSNEYVHKEYTTSQFSISLCMADNVHRKITGI